MGGGGQAAGGGIDPSASACNIASAAATEARRT